MLISMGINERELEKEFQSYGIHTPATLIGYRYFKAARRSPAGDRPVYSYTSDNGVTLTYVAYAYGVATPLKKKALETQKVMITYLPRNPNIARVDKWQGMNLYGLDIFMGTFLCLLSAAWLYSEYKSTATP
jgi:hypothetical protein